MNPDWLLKHFDQISETPDAVPRLRRFILDLAVRGKLVPQEPEDEPASELLKQVEIRRANLSTAWAFKGRVVFEQISEDELPFDLCEGWGVARMDFLALKLGAGSTPLGGKSIYQSEGIPFLRSQNVHNDGLKLDDIARIPEVTHKRMSGTHLKENDILLNITGASIGRCALLPADFGEGNVSQHVAIVRLILPNIREFVHLLLISPTYQRLIMNVQVGVSREGLSMQRLKLFPVILPPQLEQERIVAKVDELMALCDELEAAQTKREKRRDRLVAATLHRLNNRRYGSTIPRSRAIFRGSRPLKQDDDFSGTVHADFRDASRFFFNNHARLITRPEHIQRLRQTILNLAVRGRVVPQEPDDEPAFKAIELVQAQRRHHKQERTKSDPKIAEVNKPPFATPPGWTWARFPDLGIFGRGKSKYRPRNDSSLFEGGTHLFVQTGDVARSRGLIKTFTGKYNETGLAQSAKWPKGTLCITIAANIADTGILSFDACFPDSIVGFIPASPFPNARYFEYFIRTVKAELLEFAPATAQKNINLSILSEVLIPIPPLAEQHRIVKKVDELMTLCDQLETRLAFTTSTRSHLMESAMHKALNGKSEHERTIL